MVLWSNVTEVLPFPREPFNILCQNVRNIGKLGYLHVMVL